MTVHVDSQTAPGKYWVRFTDKDNSEFSLSDPAEFLSQYAVDRREKFGIGYNVLDLPVKQSYIDAVLATGECTLANRSKWFNAITIYTNDTNLIEIIATFPFVLETRSVESIVQGDKEKWALRNIGSTTKSLTSEDCESSRNYGPSLAQISMLNGQVLHEMGYTGRGIRIAVLDAGWSMTDQLPAFDRLSENDLIRSRRDFVNGGTEVYDASHHGTFVLSLMAGYIPDSLLGTAPDAEYWLFQTEDAASEYVVEEDNWVAAVEVCDSIGIDIINSSLGYSLFDDSLQNHEYSDMDGNTTRISVAADIAASKGILVVNSAGNSGDDEWHYITAPSDGDSVLCIGAVDASRNHAFFSSYGPSSDGDIKPNVCAMGFAAVIAALDSTIQTGNGTSFSSPITAGMAACLWQAHPDKNNMEIFRAIEKSAHLYLTPNDSLGYGIPDFYTAFKSLQTVAYTTGNMQVEIWPNPFTDFFNVTLHSTNACDVRFTLYDANGKLVKEELGLVSADGISVVQWNQLRGISSGVYFLRITNESETVQIKLVKR